MDYDTVMRSCDEKAQLLEVHSLTAAESVVVLISRFLLDAGLSQSLHLDADIDLSDPMWAPQPDEFSNETVAALEAIGAKNTAAELSAAIAQFADRPSSADQVPRISALASVYDAAAREEPDLDIRLREYIDAHASELQEHTAIAEPGPPADSGRDPGC